MAQPNAAATTATFPALQLAQEWYQVDHEIHKAVPCVQGVQFNQIAPATIWKMIVTVPAAWS